jgi:hypothetical protein
MLLSEYEISLAAGGTTTGPESMEPRTMGRL